MTGVSILGYLSIDALSHGDGAALRQPGGAALYAALGATLAGAQTDIAASVGPDWPEAWTAALIAMGIGTEGITQRDHPTRRTRIRHADGMRQSQHFGQADWLAATMAHRPDPARTKAGVLVATPMPVDALSDILAVAQGRPVIADTSEWVAASQAEALRGALPGLAVFAPSLEETRLLCPGLGDDDAALALAARGPCIVQKRGAQGLVVALGATLHRLPAHPTTVIDPTGAGDATVGAIAAGLAYALPPLEAARAALAAGARAVSGLGPQGLGLSVPAQTHLEEIP